MATAQTKAVGRVKCYGRKCSEVVIVRQNGADGLNASCPICDISVRAKKGTQAHMDLVNEMQPIKRDNEDAAPAAKQAAPAAKQAAPAAKQAAPAAPAAPTAKKTNFLGM